MSNLFIEVTQINEDIKCRLNDPVVSETKFSNTGELYRNLVKEYGKCVSKQYIDDPDGNTQQIGWVFEKREYYSDMRVMKDIRSLSKFEKDVRTFMCTTWVSVHSREPETKVIPHFLKF